MFSKNFWLLILLSLLVMLITFIISCLFWIKQPRLYIVSSGSMQPALSVGSLVLTTKADRYYPGEVITFQPKPEQTRFTINKHKLNVTHRVVQANYLESQPIYLTKGDANQVSDNFWIKHKQVLGRVDLVLPLAGYFLLFLQSNPVVYLVWLFFGFGLILNLYQQIGQRSDAG